MLNLKHVTAVLIASLSLMYAVDGDYSKQAITDYVVSVAVILLSVCLYGRLARQTKAEQKQDD